MSRCDVRREGADCVGDEEEEDDKVVDARLWRLVLLTSNADVLALEDEAMLRPCLSVAAHIIVIAIRDQERW